jgi:hypothetical protein
MPTDRDAQTFHDGELGWFGRWRFRKRLERKPEVRENLLGLQRLGDALREEFGSAEGRDASGSTDLWSEIAGRLPAAGIAPGTSGWLPGWTSVWGSNWDWRPAGAGLAAAALAGFLAFGQSGGGAASAPNAESIRWLDARGAPLMVLQDDAEATIIWVPSVQKVQDSGGTGQSGGDPNFNERI